MYTVKLSNETERKLVQKILFLEGYVWSSSRDTVIRYLDNEDGFNTAVIDTYYKTLYRCHDSHDNNNLSFDQFLDKIEGGNYNQ
jgi:hypothetical protein